MASRWDTRGGSSRRTWLAEARKINEDLHREIMLTEADYAWDHLFSGISLWREQSIHHMQPQLTSWHTRLLIKTPSFLPDPRHTLEIVWAPSTFTPCGTAAEWSDVWYHIRPCLKMVTHPISPPPPGPAGSVSALKQTNKFMQQGDTDLALNVHVCCLMCNTETFRHSRTFLIIGGSFWTFKVWEFQCKYSTKYYIPGFDCLQTTPVFTTSQQQQWYTLLPKGTTGYWMQLIITRGEISWEIILSSTPSFIYSLAETVSLQPANILTLQRFQQVCAPRASQRSCRTEALAQLRFTREYSM